MSTSKPTERIGLLFVHGIGQQKRFEFLRASMTEFAELMRQSGEPGEKLSASVVDRTTSWKPAPGEDHPQGLSPVELTIESDARRLVFECHEVWWADLGARAELLDSVIFWFWAFGQWLAPIYRDLDAAALKKTDSKGRWSKPASELVKLPEAVAGRLIPECRARLQLFMAALATLFVVVSWVILKRLFAAVLRKAPSPTLLVSYVGDVRTYEERARPGDTALSDPGQPRRVGIRRRMVSEMVRMGARDDLDRWYVVAHSQGSVVAYNGLTEIGHALPNYLSQRQWATVPERLRRDKGCIPRPDSEIADMMPSRPSWLSVKDVINRPLLFSKLRGFLTYGSPLNKFAAIWPRVVATATDRKPDTPAPFTDECRWVNVRALQDPVAGDVSRFFGPKDDKPGFQGCIPPIIDIGMPFRPNFLLAHLKYFDVAERFVRRMAVSQRRAIMGWIMSESPSEAPSMLDDVPKPNALREGIISLSYVLVLLLLAGFAVAAITMGHDLISALFRSVKLTWIEPMAFYERARCNVAPLMATAMMLLALAGYGRWITEAHLNLKLGLANRYFFPVRLLSIQFIASLATLPLVAGAWWLLARKATPCFAWHGLRCPSALWLVGLGGALIVAGIMVQAAVNFIVGKPLRYRARRQMASDS